MKKISRIKIKNFKGFQQEQVFDLKGKHVLAYGNNGSGKSSLFWALYTLTQSSIKEDSEIKKYFRHFSESDRETHQSLRNVFTDASEDSFIELTTVDEHSITETYTISYLIKQYKLRENKERLIEDIQDILKRIMNPASHSTLVPLYESELQEAIVGVQKLKEYLNS